MEFRVASVRIPTTGANMNPLVTRQHTPGPWHDCVADMYRRFAVVAPTVGAKYIQRRFDLLPEETHMIVDWVKLRKHTAPCPIQ